MTWNAARCAQAFQASAHMSERLHKLLAQHGLGSRREVEKWMLEGRVRLNGQLAQPGDRFHAGDRVSIDGRDVTGRLQVTASPQVLLYHKPQGQPVNPPHEGEPIAGEMSQSVMERLPSVRGARWLVINAMQPLDSGLLLVTTDGKLADALRRRAEIIPATYAVRVLVPHPEFDVTALPRTVQYDDELVEFENVEPAGGEGTNRWFRVQSQRAHRRAAVRALFEAQGLKVSRVIQLEFAGLALPRELSRGRHRALTPAQMQALYDLAGLQLPTEPVRRPHVRGRPDPSAPNRRIPPDRRATGNRKKRR